MKKTLLFALVLATATLFTSCNNYGKKVTINEHLEVLLKNDATEEEGKKLGEYFQTITNENKEQISIQLQKENDLYTIRLIVKEEVLKDTSIESSFQTLQAAIKETVFPGKTVRLILTDENFKDKITVKELDPGPSTNDPAINAAGENTVPGELKAQGGRDRDTIGGNKK